MSERCRPNMAACPAVTFEHGQVTVLSSILCHAESGTFEGLESLLLKDDQAEYSSCSVWISGICDSDFSQPAQLPSSTSTAGFVLSASDKT